MIRFAIFTALLATSAQAAQVVVTEVTYTHSGTTTSDSHYIVNPLPGTPSDWTSPVNYAMGTAVVRLEVFTKPTATPTRFQICFEGTPSYACTNQAPAYTTTGVYTWTTPFPNFYQYSQVDWTKGTRRIALILKDTMNGKPSPENVGAATSALYMPTDLRVTVTLVAPGSTYIPPDATDAGVVDAGVADAGVADAGNSVDAGAAPMDAGQAAAPDSGMSDAGSDERPPAMSEVRGGCAAAPAAPLFFLALLAFSRRRQRSRRATSRVVAPAP